jgi:predicted RND superfamily exporter protein
MNSLISLAARNATAVFILLIALTAAAVMQLPNVQIQVSAQGLIVEDDPAYQQHEKMQQTFGGSESIAVIMRDQQLFSRAKLVRIEQVHRQLEKLDFVEGIDSLFTVDHVTNVDGDIRFSPYLDPVPESDEALLAVREQALLNPFIVKNLLSPDATTMAFNLRMKKGEELTISDSEIVTQINSILEPINGQLDEVFALGMPYVLGGLSDLIKVDQKSVLPFSLLALLLVLFITLRRPTAVILPFLTAGMSVIWTLALMSLAGYPINVMTSIVPALLVVIGSTEDIHLLSAWYHARARGEAGLAAINSMSSATGLAIILTFVTTYMGFLSIALNDISLLQEFGLVASTGLLLNFVITITLIPAVLSRFKTSEKKSSAHRENRNGIDAYGKFASRLFTAVSANRRPIVILALVITAVSLFWATRIKVDNDHMSYFNEDAPIHYKSRFMHDHLAGMQTLDIILTSPIEDTFQRLRYLETVEALQHYLDESGYFDKTTSFVDYVKLINQVMEGLNPDEFYLPEEDGLIREYMLFVSPESVQPYVDQQFTSTRIIARHDISSSVELKQAIADIEKFAAEQLLPGLGLVITGDAVLSKRAADRMVKGQVTSLLFMLVVIVTIISVLFLSFKAGLVAAIPNIFPVIILFGIMGMTGVSLNTGTAMVAAIAIGICVDDTMHFLVSYNQQMRYHDDPVDGIRAALEYEARPIMSTSMALALGFGVLAFSDFPPVVDFGLLSAIVIVLAVIANFVLLPILLYYIRLVTIWDVLSVQLQSTLIDKCELFINMRPFEVRKLIAMSRRMIYEEGEQIVEYGEVGDEVFVILSGSVRVRVPLRREGEEGKYRHAANLGIGTVFGEIAFLGQIQRTADVFAEGKTEVLSLQTDAIRRFSRFLPRTATKLYFNLSRILAKRLGGTVK